MTYRNILFNVASYHEKVKTFKPPLKTPVLVTLLTT